MEARSFGRPETPAHGSRCNIEGNERVVLREYVDKLTVANNIGRHRTTHMMFPPNAASHLLERVYIAFRTTIRGRNHQVVRDEPVSMDPGLITVLSDVVAPLRYSGVAVDPDE